MEQGVSQRVLRYVSGVCGRRGRRVRVRVRVRACVCVCALVRDVAPLRRRRGGWGFDGSGNGSEELYN